MTPAQRLFSRALQEKVAFLPMDSKTGQQAAGPDGVPVDPMAAGAPPGAGGPAGAPPPPGGAPMDPAAAGGAPGGAGIPPPPGGAPPPPGAPMDPGAAGGAPPAPGGDAGAGGADPLAALMGSGTPGAAPGSPGDPSVPISALKEFATAIIEATKGKRTADPMVPGDKKPGSDVGAPPSPGPVTGLPGDLSGMAGDLAGMGGGGAPKMAAAKTALVLFRK